MQNLLRGLLALALILPTIAAAHGPSRQKVIETIEINAPAEKVWGLIADFCAIENWHPAITECVGEGGNEKGATRVLTVGEKGAQIHEEMKKYEPEEMKYSYKITATDISVLPVSPGTYAAAIMVKPSADGGSSVEWNAKFYRSYTKNNPPPEQSDEAAINAVTAVFKTGLENLKKIAE